MELHPVVVAIPPHEAARWGGEAALVQPHEADDVAIWRVGLPVRAGGTIHAEYIPSPVAASSPSFTSLFSANGVTIDWVQGRRL
jgi:hypothetical protein